MVQVSHAGNAAGRLNAKLLIYRAECGGVVGPEGVIETGKTVCFRAMWPTVGGCWLLLRINGLDWVVSHGLPVHRCQQCDALRAQIGAGCAARVDLGRFGGGMAMHGHDLILCCAVHCHEFASGFSDAVA